MDLRCIVLGVDAVIDTAIAATFQESMTVARPSAPRYWKARKGFYAMIRGKRHLLAKGPDDAVTRAEATRAFHRLMAGDGALPRGVDLTVALACDLYLENSSRVHAEGTTEQIRVKLQSFCDLYGGLGLADLRPSHVARWVAEHRWSQTTQRQAIGIVKQACAHAVRERLIAENPIASVRRPAAQNRTKTLSPAERATIRDGASDDAFRDFLAVLSATGARPGEVARIEARHVDWEAGAATMPGKTTRATGKPRTIYLPGPALAVLRRRAETVKSGPLLRNANGEPWTNEAIRARFRRMRERLGLDPDVVAYAYRHSFITDGLERGVPAATVAELAGHTDLNMISRVYGHLSERREHLRRAAEIAGGEVKPGGA
jgi:integrase